MKCTPCAANNGLHAIGNCSGCGATISQMSNMYCSKCSIAKNACEGCGCQLTPANSDATTGSTAMRSEGLRE